MNLDAILNGHNPIVVMVLPMLGRKTRDYPMYESCYITDDATVAIISRVAGKLRGKGLGEEELCADENFVTTYDMPENDRYAVYEFRVPDEWQDDFQHFLNGEMNDISDEYVELVKCVYPKLAESGKLDIAFGRKRPPSRKKAKAKTKA